MRIWSDYDLSGGSGSLGSDLVQNIDLVPDQDPRLQKISKFPRLLSNIFLGVKLVNKFIQAGSEFAIIKFEKSDTDPNSFKVLLNWHFCIVEYFCKIS
jgi:hypothetical protein